ncbi:hypothetical protein TorRG33x02_270670 [Trema orientale]|uniref:Uncharacterized protein n=1 Tax=Trema orientale TaxID=63057 RepID=A0A2P5CWQ4_TREOI|nr:hypothetical protein TorRG33x02_270670 [Trema orientale]
MWDCRAYPVSTTCGSAVEKNGEESVDEEGEGDGGVLEVVEVVGRDGAIRVERLVPLGADKELHGDRGRAAGHDEDELGVLGWLGGREPGWSSVGVWMKSMELDMVVEVP